MMEEYSPNRPLLLIDDSPQNLRLACFLLMADGLEVWTATSAEQALELMAGQRFSLLLVDIQMPGMGGLGLAKRVREMPGWEDVLIVALTACAMRGDRERMLAAGCDGYIAKPIDTRSFAGQVREYLHSACEPDMDDHLRSELEAITVDFLRHTGTEVRRLLALPDELLRGSQPMDAFHRWSGAGGSEGMDAVAGRARRAWRELSGLNTIDEFRVRAALTDMLGLIESEECDGRRCG